MSGEHRTAHEGGYDQAGPFIAGGWGPQVRSTRYYQHGSEAEIRVYVLRSDDVASAEQAVTSAVSAP